MELRRIDQHFRKKKMLLLEYPAQETFSKAENAHPLKTESL